jgi:hypothetical protein
MSTLKSNCTRSVVFNGLWFGTSLYEFITILAQGTFIAYALMLGVFIFTLPPHLLNMGVKFRRFKFEGLEPDLPSGSFAWFHPAGSSSTSTKLSLHPPLHSHQYKLYSHAFEHPHFASASS